MLDSGRIDLASTVDLTGYKIIKKYLDKSSLDDLSVLGGPYYVGEAGLCFSGTSKEKDRAFFEHGLKMLKASGKYKSIVMAELNEILERGISKYYKEFWEI